MLRLSFAALALALATASCGGGTVDSLDGGLDTPTVAAVTPEFGPLSGGTRVVITGSGFLHGAAPPNRVLVGGVEASGGGVIDDRTLEIVLPPSATPGDAEIVVFNRNGRGSATGVFHYSEPPTITDVTPSFADIEGGDMITIHGTGFIDEAAGPVTVLMNGERVYDVEVPNDGTLIFPAPAGEILSRPDIQLENARGEAAQVDAFQYVVNGSTAGLLVFPSIATDTFAWFIDTVGSVSHEIPNATGIPNPPAYKAAARNAAGVWVVNRNDNTLNRLDIEAQTTTRVGTTAGSVPSMAFRGDTLLVFRRCNTFGTLDTTNGTFTQISTTLNTCQGALAVDSGGTLYAVTTNSTALVTLDPTTGALGTPVAFTPAIAPFHVSGMTFHAGVLYATLTNSNTQSSKLVTINPATAAVVDVLSFPGKVADLVEMP